MPSRNGKFIEESNCVPFVSGLVGSYSQPVYETVTVRPRVAVAPVPSRMSVAENGAEGGADVFDGELSPPPHAAALSAIAMTSAMRTGTVSSVRSRLVSASQYTLAPMAANTITAGVRPAIASIRIPYEGVELPRNGRHCRQPVRPHGAQPHQYARRVVELRATSHSGRIKHAASQSDRL